MQTFFTSDLRLGGSKDRDKEIIENWNSYAGKGKCLTYILGNFARENHSRYLDKLYGKKILIKDENCENINEKALSKFSEVYEGIRKNKWDKKDFVLSKHRLHSWQRSYHGSWHFYGTRLAERDNVLSCSVSTQLWKKRPVPIEILEEKMKSRYEKRKKGLEFLESEEHLNAVMERTEKLRKENKKYLEMWKENKNDFPNIVILADPHLGDYGILKHCKNRDFINSYYMDQEIIRKYKELVDDKTIVHFLGDMANGQAKSYLPSFKGKKKILIRGNHDKNRDLREFDESHNILNFEIDGQRIVECHYPMDTWTGMELYSILIHGHCHGRLSEYPDFLRCDASYDAWNGPVPIGALMLKMQDRLNYMKENKIRPTDKIDGNLDKVCIENNRLYP